MKSINVMLVYIICGLIETQVAGKASSDGLSLSNILYPITNQIPSFAEEVSSICFRPFEDTGCDNNAESNDIGGGISMGQTMAFLFTEKNPSTPEFLHKCGGHLPENTNFNPECRTEIFIHGWLDGVCRTKWMREMKDELLKRGSYNVILIDWTWGNGREYNISAENSYIVKIHVACVIQNIMKSCGVGPDNFHLVGHSIGAHIAGLVGKIIPNLRRVTGLDPALESYNDKPTTDKLHYTDAQFVDVIHPGGVIVGGKTIWDRTPLDDSTPLGHADFYPNSGKEQDSCKPYMVESFKKLDLMHGSISPILCNHVQSLQYYKASINPMACEFIGVQCPDYESFESGRCTASTEGDARCAIMGMDFENSIHLSPNEGHCRKYYLSTTLRYPYCTN